jgi:cytoskeletal protein CcmA (bactofilin family)
VFWKRRGGVNSNRRGTERERAKPVAQGNNLVAPVPVLRSSLGHDTVVSGRLSFTMPTRIDGTLRGEVRASEMLVVGEDAVVEGVIRALRLVVLGQVRGEVRGAAQVEIGSSGRLIGTVEAHSLVVQEGGCLDGDCRIAPPRAPLRVLRSVPAVASS